MEKEDKKEQRELGGLWGLSELMCAWRCSEPPRKVWCPVPKESGLFIIRPVMSGAHGSD